ncbi:hypothetical protein BDY21DRAFT_38813 [Lineolata rhizophorae]|uniref:Cora-like Mg2+ transporter protein-domain-containing protein n=1 Tax=Lineolata rhizophorae TaxID=578093 RepID=A0A6A6P011_9PEZI|nr:hypothetical protein BDY21DRAFT_38813 [Lineolata rhizophorae]
MRRKACGYFCCQDVPDKNGNRMGHVTMMKSLTIKVEDEPRQRSDETGKRNYFPYEWLPLELAVFWHDKRRTLQAVVMQASPEVRERIKKVLLPGTTPPFHLEPLGLHVFLFERVLEMYDNSFWFLRDNLPKVESRQKPGDTPRPDYPLVHDLARHVIHHTESLEIAIDTLDTLKSCHDECGHDEAGVTTSPVSPQGGGPGATSAGASSGTDHGGLTTALATAGTRFDAQLVAQRNAIQQHRRLLRHYDKMLRQFLARSRSLNERIRNEINLSFNSVVQYDSRAMKTISFLTLFFLPGTFVSSILGTNFFNYGEHDPRFHMSSLFWPGWAAPTVGLTLAVLLIWWKWYASSTKVRTSGGSGPKVKGARWGFGVRREETEDGDGTASQRKHRRKVVVPGWKSFNSSQARLDAVPNSAA